jgi:peptidoglycan/xylan/chitin deacetylase (PgdA/CDA1 family)
MGHGITNSILLNQQGEDEERAILKEAVETIAKGTGKRPRGWLGPGLSETVQTLDLLAEAGIEYVGDWVNDEQPYPMTVRAGSILSMPYSVELNDIPNFLARNRTGEEFARQICDQFDVLYEDGAKTGRVMSICLHPFLIGHPHRSKYFAEALRHITSRREVWIATGGEIAQWYRKTYL